MVRLLGLMWLTLSIMIHSGGVFAQVKLRNIEEACGPAVEIQSETLRGNLEGQAQSLAKLAEGELKGQAERTRMNILLGSNRSDDTRALLYIYRTTCVAIFTDSKLTTDQRISKIQTLYRYLRPDKISEWQPKNYVYGTFLGVAPPTDCPCVSREVISQIDRGHFTEYNGRRYQCFKAEYRYVNLCIDGIEVRFSKWENVVIGGRADKRYYDWRASLEPKTAILVQLEDVCLDLDFSRVYTKCSTNKNLFFQTGIPAGLSRGCLVEKSTFAARGKPWGPTSCTTTNAGAPGQPCFCSLAGVNYPGTYMSSD